MVHDSCAVRGAGEGEKERGGGETLERAGRRCSGGGGQAEGGIPRLGRAPPRTAHQKEEDRDQQALGYERGVAAVLLLVDAARRG